MPTNSVDAIRVLLLPATWVGAVGCPVKTGLVNIVAFDSFVTLPKLTCVAVTLWGLLVLLV